MIAPADERRVLEECLTQAYSDLSHYRDEGLYLQADTTEADINRILEELQSRFYPEGEAACTPCRDNRAHSGSPTKGAR